MQTRKHLQKKLHLGHSAFSSTLIEAAKILSEITEIDLLNVKKGNKYQAKDFAKDQVGKKQSRKQHTDQKIKSIYI